MRAARITGPRQFRIENVPKPSPGPSQVRVRLEGCGVCGSNLAVWQGRRWLSYPFDAGSPGHEGWGVVDVVGDGVQELHAGERVALLSYHAYAEYDLAEADQVVRVPPQTEVFPGEALGCATNIFNRSDVQPGQTVAILGVGFLGALLTQFCTAAGARVIALSRRQFALDVGRAAGAAEALDIRDPGAAARVNDLTNGRGCERVIEAAGEQETLDLASEIIGVRGRLIIAGYHQDSPRRVNMQLWNWRGIDVINAHERDPNRYIDGMRSAAEMITRGALDPSLLYTHSFGLDEFPDALDALEQRPNGFLKAWIRMND
jgi:threonine dehydrogenase-like Zn-dependent dehydrogenase